MIKLSSHLEYANLPPRLLASLLDGFLFSLPVGLFLVEVAKSKTFDELVQNGVWFVTFVFFPSIILSFANVLGGTWRWGKTIGKAIIDLEVVSLDGKELTFDQVLIREVFGKAVSSFLFFAGYVVCLIDPLHQTWHDQLAGTVVKKGENRVGIGLLLLVGLVALTLYTGYSLVAAVMSNPIFRI